MSRVFNYRPIASDKNDLGTVDSTELQNMVSRAIRSSASTSFIRLLSEENLDKVLPAELERLDTLKAVTQSKYRFLVQRRTMLFQALNSASLGQQKDGEDGVSVVSRLTLQLADTVTECDKNLEQLLQISDQIAQINKLMEVHWSSALAIALRKVGPILRLFSGENADCFITSLTGAMPVGYQTSAQRENG